MSSDGAAGGRAAFKGFRYQVLAALAHYFRAPKSTIHLEGEEDFDVVEQGEPRRHFQAKADKALTLSAIIETYLPRVRTRSAEGLDILVLANPPGPELRKAWAGDSSHLANVCDKIAKRLKISKGEAKKLFQRVQPVVELEADLLAELAKSIQGARMFGSTEVTRDLLLHWISVASESSLAVAPGDLQARMQQVVEYLTQLSSNREWGISIDNIGETVDHALTVHELATEYSDGVAARLEHIQAGLDVPRPSQLQRILEGFSSGHRIVVLKGASGQGKSSLALRFLLDHVEPHLRFILHPRNDVTHFRSIFAALKGHLYTFDLPVFCLIDVAPGFTAWSDLVSVLQAHRQLRLLVCIREEDWNRSAIDGRFETPLMLDADLTELEARDLFARVSASPRERLYPDFDEAWRVFGGAGPLLEFVYLLRRGESLQSRLEAQIGALTVNERKLLRKVTLADECGCELEIDSLGDLDSVLDITRKLQQEHLASPVNRRLRGTHPIRSRIVCKLLHGEIIPVARTACEILPAIPDLHLENFLLHLFTHYPDSRQGLVDALSELKPRTWTEASAALKSLLWLGLQFNIESNRHLAEEMWMEFEELTPSLLHTHLDCGLLSLTDPDLVIPLWENDSPVFESLRNRVVDLTPRWVGRDEIHTFARDWLRTVDIRCVALPQSDGDWQGYCWILHWSRLLDAPLTTEAAVSQAPKSCPPEIGLETAAAVYQCLHASVGSEPLSDLHAAVLERYRKSMLVLETKAEASNAVVQYLVDVEHPEPYKLPLRHLSIMRGLFPDVATYSIRGWGYLRDQTDFEQLRRDGVPRHHLPPKWSVELNVWLSGILLLQFRPTDWSDYVSRATLTRRRLIECLEIFNSAIDDHWKPQDMLGVFRGTLDIHRLTEFTRMRGMGSLLPSEVTDSFGRLHESVDFQRVGLPCGTQRYLSFRKSLSAARTSTENLIRQLPFAMLLLASKEIVKIAPAFADRYLGVVEGVRTAGYSEELPSIAWGNFSDLQERLPDVGAQFGQYFSGLMEPDTLSRLETKESDALEGLKIRLACIAKTPNRMDCDIAQVGAEYRDLLTGLKEDLKNQLKSGLSRHKERIRSARVFEVANGSFNSMTLCVAYTLTSPMYQDLLANSVLQCIRQVFPLEPREPNEFTPSLAWPTIAMFELFDDRLLEPVCRVVPTRFRYENFLTRNESADLYPPVPLPVSALEVLSYTPWPADPAVGRFFAETWSKVITQLGELSSLLEMSDVDDTAIDVLQGWSNRMSAAISADLQKTLDTMTIFARDISGRLSSLSPTAQEAALEVFPALEKLGQFLVDSIPDGELRRPLGFWATWLQELKERQEFVRLIRAGWLVVTLSNSEGSKGPKQDDRNPMGEDAITGSTNEFDRLVESSQGATLLKNLQQNGLAIKQSIKVMKAEIGRLRAKGWATHRVIWDACLCTNTTTLDYSLLLSTFLKERDKGRRGLILKKLATLLLEASEALTSAYGARFRGAAKKLSIPSASMDKTNFQLERVRQFATDHGELLKNVAESRRGAESQVLSNGVDTLDHLQLFTLGTEFHGILNELGVSAQGIMTETSNVSPPELQGG